MLTRDKVRGMLLGTAIGDALGMPVETFDPEKILEKYPDQQGRITQYLEPTGHKWFDGHAAGTWTDDTQLTLAVARGIIDAKGILDIDAHAKRHIEALDDTTDGWGATTRDAVRNLKEGSSPFESGIYGEWKGCGNGVAMKIAPVAAYIESRRLGYCGWFGDGTNKFIRDLSLMTHKTTMGVESGFCQSFALQYCLSIEPDKFDSKYFINEVLLNALEISIDYLKLKNEMVADSDDSLFSRFDNELRDFADLSQEKAREAFGNGSCYIYNSLPFTYAFFLQNTQSIESLYKVIAAGGDTDTNGSMVAAMLGALHGVSIFPPHLIRGLDRIEEILSVTDSLCEVLCIPKDEDAYLKGPSAKSIGINGKVEKTEYMMSNDGNLLKCEPQEDKSCSVL